MQKHLKDDSEKWDDVLELNFKCQSQGSEFLSYSYTYSEFWDSVTL